MSSNSSFGYHRPRRRASAGGVHAQALEGRLKRIAEKKTIAIAYRADAIPFSFERDGQPVGYSIDLCKRVVNSIERAIKVQPLKVEWVPVSVQTPSRR